MKALIVDDSSMMRLMLKSLLKQAGISDSYEARDGREALTMMQAHEFDVVLMDVHMPNMDGPTCLQSMKTSPKTAGIPVIVISSDADPAQVENSKLSGALTYIKKPFRIEGLREALNLACPNWTASIQ